MNVFPHYGSAHKLKEAMGPYTLLSPTLHPMRLFYLVKILIHNGIESFFDSIEHTNAHRHTRAVSVGGERVNEQY